MKRIMLFILIFVSLLNFSVLAQNDTTNNQQFNKKRFILLTSSLSAGYVGSMTALSQIWYADYPKSSFHLFNDNKGWLYMDKFGHSMTSYYVGRLACETFRWTGMNDNKAIWYGGSLGLLFLTSVEMLDGFSKEWGFSLGDVIANTSGTVLFIGQEKLWKEQRLSLKWSFHFTDLAQHRPNSLGSVKTERWLKDYNGQTYWLSINLKSFMKNESKLPEWLNLAVGYGADGMLGGEDNIWESEGVEYDYSHIKRYSQYYISPDIDFTKIKTKSKFLNHTLKAISFFKFPLPTLEISNNKFKFHALYF